MTQAAAARGDVVELDVEGEGAVAGASSEGHTLCDAVRDCLDPFTSIKEMMDAVDKGLLDKDVAREKIEESCEAQERNRKGKRPREEE